MVKKCLHCQTDFSITTEDLAFYKKISPTFNNSLQLIPSPTQCPECREQRRLATRNDNHLYNRKCSNCHTSIVSIYSADKPYTVYCSACWWQDTWDPQKYGLHFDTQQSIFDIIKALQRTVPRLALINRETENSEYTHYTSHNKNCYLIFNADNNQDCFYSYSLDGSKDCMEMYWSGRSELCYEGISLGTSYDSQFCNHSINLSNCYFCFDCKDCHDCYGCYSIEHKQFHIFNQPYSKEAYQKKLATILQQKKSYQGLQQLKKEVQDFFLTMPHKYAIITHSENCSGNYLVNCENCTDCYYLVNSQDCKYISEGGELKDGYDSNFSGMKGSELMYEVQDCWFGYQMLFSVSCWNCNNMYYSDHCFHSQNCFGCVGLRHKEYCIFNVQYSKEQYERIVPHIIEQMNKQHEWGEFFPLKNSLFYIEETEATEEKDHTQVEIHDQNIIIPDHIDDVPDSIIHSPLACENCGRSFRIISQELEFYRQHLLPLPHYCYLCRQQKRKEQLPPKKLFSRNCDQCQKLLMSPYPPQAKEIIYCGKCFGDEHK